MPLIAIDLITIGERIRKDFGDLQSLANSMAEIGQLQPIGVTSEDLDGHMFLVFGERRLRAARDILHWDTIDVKAVDLDAIILGELHENEMRKDFTVSERVAIGKAIEDYIGNRQGQRTDIALPVILQEVDKGKQTKEIAAEKAGFGSESTYRQAQKVIEQAEPELTEAVDTGSLPVSQAVKIIGAPPETQRQVAQLAQSGQTRAARAVIQDPQILQAWDRYPELQARDIPTQYVITMASSLDDMDETTRVEKREAFRQRTPGVSAELAQLPPMPVADETDKNDEQNIQWHKACNQITTLLNSLEETGYLQGMIHNWTLEIQQQQLKSFTRLRNQMTTIVQSLETAIHTHEVTRA